LISLAVSIRAVNIVQTHGMKDLLIFGGLRYIPRGGYNGVWARPPRGGWRKSVAGRLREILPNITE